MPVTGRFEDSSVFVTGAASGIGLAAAHAFAAEGAWVTLADIDGDGAAAAAAAIGPRAMAVTVDVTDRNACASGVAAAVKWRGRLDVAFNNAGVPSRITAEFEDIGWDEWQRTIDVNLGGIFNCLKAEVPAMKATGGGTIVNTASVASLVGSAGASAYIAAKHGVAGLTKGAAIDLIRHGIRVNAVCPGLVATPMLGGAARYADRAGDGGGRAAGPRGGRGGDRPRRAVPGRPRIELSRRHAPHSRRRRHAAIGARKAT
ncbi:MAG: SDR family NAD(P)-dependent oxidoreductase [Sphingomonas fennica]